MNYARGAINIPGAKTPGFAEPISPIEMERNIAQATQQKSRPGVSLGHGSSSISRNIGWPNAGPWLSAPRGAFTFKQLYNLGGLND